MSYFLTATAADPLAHQQEENQTGSDITWTLRAMPKPEWEMGQWTGTARFISVYSHGTNEGKPQDETHYEVSSLCIGANAIIKAARQLWSIENSWHWVRDVPLREVARWYREDNNVQIVQIVGP